MKSAMPPWAPAHAPPRNARLLRERSAVDGEKT